MSRKLVLGDKMKLVCKVVRVTGPRSVEDCEVIRESLTAPFFSDTQLSIEDIRFVSGKGAVCRLKISGVIRSALCDLIPGEAGAIKEFALFVMGDFERTQQTQVSKTVDPGSSSRPFPMQATFNHVIDDITISTGTIWFELRAKNPFKDGLTGLVSFTVGVDVDEAFYRKVTLSGHGLDYVADPGESPYSAAAPKPLASSTGGELNVYALKLVGNREQLEALASVPERRIVRGSDGDFYIGDKTVGIEFNILSLLSRSHTVEEFPSDANASYNDGFLSGMILGGADFCRGSLRVEVSSPRVAEATVSVNPDATRDGNLTLVLDKRYRLPASVEDCSEPTRTVLKYLNSVTANDQSVVEVVARGDWEPFLSVSQDFVDNGMSTLFVLQDLSAEQSGGTRQELLGQLQARTFLEGLRIACSDGQFGSLRTSEVLEKLRQSTLFAPPRRRSLIERVIDSWRSLPFAN